MAAAFVGAVSLAIYIITLAPTVLADDSPEYVTCVHKLGILHPTGYPLYLLTGKLFDLLPVATPPVRLGFFSALSAAAAAAAIAWATARLTSCAPAAILAGLIVAFNDSLWGQATEPSVYAFNALIVSLAIIVFLGRGESYRPRQIVLLFFLAGIGLAHHRTAIFFTAPLCLAAVILHRPRLRLLAKAVAAGLAPLALYLYLPIRAAAHAPTVWGDLSQWHHFLAHILALGYYSNLAFARPAAEELGLAKTLITSAWSQFTPGGVAIALIGFVALFRTRRDLGLPMTAGAVLLTIWNLGYDVPNWDVYFIPLVLAVGIWAGVGLAALSNGLRSLIGDRRGWGRSVLAAAVLLFIPISLLQENWSKDSHQGDWANYDSALLILGQLPSRAVLVTNTDNGLFMSFYMQVVEGRRPDIYVVCTNRAITPWRRDAVLTPIVTNLLAHWYRPPRRDLEERGRNAVLFAASLAKAINYSRPIYCLASIGESRPDPPAIPLEVHFLRISQQRPQLLAPLIGSDMAGDYPGGISLARVSVEPRTASPRDLLHVTLDWRCLQYVDTPPMVLVHLIRQTPSGDLLTPPGMRVGYATWFAYGTAPLPPTPAGSVYRQQLTAIVPTNAPPGRWWVSVTLPSNRNEAFTTRLVAHFRVVPPRVTVNHP